MERINGQVVFWIFIAGLVSVMVLSGMVIGISFAHQEKVCGEGMTQDVLTRMCMFDDLCDTNENICSPVWFGR